MKALLLTLIAMIAFAANSLLCRLALGEGLIDAASFTAIRTVSGAVTLVLLVLHTCSGVWYFTELARDRRPYSPREALRAQRARQQSDASETPKGRDLRDQR